jgi:hypothetical protein
MSFAGNGSTEGKQTRKVEAYYFHFTTRCATCRAVEEQTKRDIEILYPRQVKDGTISFKALNLEEPDGKSLGEKLKISGQTVLIVSGNKKINLTNEGFLLVQSNPDKYKNIIKQKIDNLLADNQ